MGRDLHKQTFLVTGADSISDIIISRGNQQQQFVEYLRVKLLQLDANIARAAHHDSAIICEVGACHF